MDTVSTRRPVRGRCSLADVLAPIEQIAATSPSLIANHGASFEVGGESYELPRYLYLGPKGGADTLRVGVFAGVHGVSSLAMAAVVASAWERMRKRG